MHLHNRKRGTLIVVEDAVPDAAQDFAYTAGGGLSPASFSLDDDADGTLSNSRTFSNLPPASGYSSPRVGTERLAAGLCHLRRRQPDIEHRVGTGETVTCTFTNNKRGKIVVVKDATPNDPQDFTFTTGGGLRPRASSSTTTPTGPSRTPARSATCRRSSGYSWPETVPSGWDQTAATCNDGSPVTNINVSPGENVTCTFANRKRGKIVVVEDAQARRPAGLRLHGRRRPVARRLPARRRLRRHAVQHADFR